MSSYLHAQAFGALVGVLKKPRRAQLVIKGHHRGRVGDRHDGSAAPADLVDVYVVVAIV
jgi:hypothetical protein